MNSPVTVSIGDFAVFTTGMYGRSNSWRMSLAYFLRSLGGCINPIPLPAVFAVDIRRPIVEPDCLAVTTVAVVAFD